MTTTREGPLNRWYLGAWGLLWLQQETSLSWRRLSWLLTLLGATAQWLIQSRTGGWHHPGAIGFVRATGLAPQ
ncbi:hypothetical protein [Ferrimonas balearica]|uniref:hypothetical protein n=1 Tax=Ferrimonas balearica TaxID=44012 RepID=UPI001C983529|nr:hypothetical protein [Ferrimonas balearica]MBY6225809.1 hypothetical protein [Ferrimonas balearica]